MTIESTHDYRVRILGSGSSGGVPRFGGEDGKGDWGACNPAEPRNRRTRCSILVERAHPEFGFDHKTNTSVLVDTSPDMRAQLLDANCSHLDAVLFTHDHADQAHGIDDLRVFAIANRKRIPVYLDNDTAGHLLTRFSYCFEQANGSPYPAILDRKVIPPMGNVFHLGGPAGAIAASAFLQFHGSVNSLGFRFGKMAYSSDVVGMPEESFALLEGLDLWIVDALQPTPHATHAHLDLALEWAERLAPKHTVLTNLHVSMDYQSLLDQLPDNIEPAFDGLTLGFNGDTHQ